MTHLESVSVDDLRQILAEVEGEDATKRVMVALNYKHEDDVTQSDLADRYGMSSGWVSRWLNRLERLETEPFEDVVYDEPRSGRPSDLSDQQHERFVEVLHEPPKEADMDARAWTVPLAQHYLKEQFGVEYCDRHVRRLMTEAGLSRQTARPQYVKADNRAQEAFREGFKKSSPIWTTSTQS